jgi:hypothetical protein
LPLVALLPARLSWLLLVALLVTAALLLALLVVR